MRKPKTKIRNFRCTEDLDLLLQTAAEAVEADPSRLLRDFVRDGSELILNDSRVQEQLRRRYAA
jgi:hypothetical protein